jgi:tetratricopeptide (TPR) repeat protein
MAGRLVDEDPDLAYRHAKAARRLASRIGLVREAAGLAAYHAGEWADALAELRAARRLGGEEGDFLAIMADAERGLGRPERALDLARSPEAAKLDQEERIELRIVESGARRDLGQFDAGVLALQIPELKDRRLRPWSARLFYAYADALVEAGRDDDARDWFARAAAADRDDETGAAERYAELEGLEIIDTIDDEDPDAAFSEGPESSADEEPESPSPTLVEAGSAELIGDPMLSEGSEPSSDSEPESLGLAEAGSVLADDDAESVFSQDSEPAAGDELESPSSELAEAGSAEPLDGDDLDSALSEGPEPSTDDESESASPAVAEGGSAEPSADAHESGASAEPPANAFPAVSFSAPEAVEPVRPAVEAVPEIFFTPPPIEATEPDEKDSD